MPGLFLYDSFSRAKQPVRTPEPGKPITLYVCGPTVYGRAHIGNARSAVVFDTLYRLLRHLHGAENVRYARNITDIDDKIMAKAVAENVAPHAIAARYEAHYFEDMAALGCLKPDFNPRATDHIAGDHGMIAMIAALVARGVAYAAQGHVLFEVAKFAGYGQLSKRPMDDMIAGARVEVAPYKRSPGDFVLWKPSTPDQPGWDSPWGRGRPGWHIECSAMIRAVLGEETIDIHGGGLDLQFPHHENERAQSCCAHGGAELARIWMHNGFLTMGETKMSKSLGNIVTPRELLDAGWPGEVLRLALLSAHYRQPLQWTDALLEQSKSLIGNWLIDDQFEDPAIVYPDSAELVYSDVVTALYDDLNFPAARVLLSRHAANAFDPRNSVERSIDWHATASLLGLEVSRRSRLRDISEKQKNAIEQEIAHYRNARAAKDWAAADAIRDALKADGIEISVAKDGSTSWRRA
jgi:cysteinyl-tRNA synthetase